MKKLISTIILFALLLLPLSSCENTDFEGESITQSETQTEALALPSDTDVSDYTIVLSPDLSPNDRFEVRSLLGTLTTEHGLKIDFRLGSGDELGAREIALDVESNSLKYGEYSIVHDAAKETISIKGFSGDVAIDALEYFINTYLDTETKSITIPTSLEYRHSLDYPFDEIKIDGVGIEEYVIIVPSPDDLCAYYTAQNLSDYILKASGYKLSVVDDDKAEESTYEILIGDTNRAADDLDTLPLVGEYYIALKDGKLVLRGDGIYVGAGFGKYIASKLDRSTPSVNITDIPAEGKTEKYTAEGKAENVILMIGDGMGHNHINAALNTGLERFEARTFPNVGESITRSQSVINGEAEYTDSAAAGTAMATGHKTLNGRLGRDADGKPLENVRALADSVGAKTAVITTDAITGATPSAFLVQNYSRNNTEAIEKGINKLIEEGKIEYCIGSVGDTLPKHIRTAFDLIANTGTPFFMMVEEGRIDSYSHTNALEKSLSKVVHFNEAIIFASTYAMIDGNTALVVTADHETGGLTPDESSNVGYSYTTTNHTNVNVAIYAIGAGTEVFNGVAVENTEIANFIASHFSAE